MIPVSTIRPKAMLPENFHRGGRTPFVRQAMIQRRFDGVVIG